MSALSSGLDLDDEVVVVRLLVAQVPLDRGPLQPKLLDLAAELGHLQQLSALGPGAAAPFVTGLCRRRPSTWPGRS